MRSTHPNILKTDIDMKKSEDFYLGQIESQKFIIELLIEKLSAPALAATSFQLPALAEDTNFNPYGTIPIAEVIQSGPDPTPPQEHQGSPGALGKWNPDKEYFTCTDQEIETLFHEGRIKVGKGKSEGKVKWGSKIFQEDPEAAQVWRGSPILIKNTQKDLVNRLIETYKK